MLAERFNLTGIGPKLLRPPVMINNSFGEKDGTA
jgi:hypothetical protein